MVDGGSCSSQPVEVLLLRAGSATFNLDDDPVELNDLCVDTPLVRALDGELRLLLDPDTTDERAKSDQAERLATLTRG